MLTFERLQEFTELLVDVFESLVVFYPLMEFSFDLFGIQKPSLVDFLILLVLIVIDHPSPLFHPQIILEIIIQETSYIITFVHAILSLLHFSFSFSPGNVILLNILLVDAFILIVIEFGNDFVISLLVFNDILTTLFTDWIVPLFIFDMLHLLASLFIRWLVLLGSLSSWHYGF